MQNITRNEKSEILNDLFADWLIENYQKNDLFKHAISLLNSKQKDNLLQYVIDNYENELNETLNYLGY